MEGSLPLGSSQCYILGLGHATLSGTLPATGVCCFSPGSIACPLSTMPSSFLILPPPPSSAQLFSPALQLLSSWLLCRFRGSALC